MTWSGYFYNIFTSEPSLTSSDVEAKKVQPNVNQPVTNNLIRSSNPVANASARQELLQGNQMQGDNSLNDVSRSLDELHRIGITMGETLDNHNVTLDRLNDKSEKVQDSTLEVLLKSSLLISSSSSSKCELLGDYCFNLHTGGFLAVTGDYLSLSSVQDLSTTFRCFVKEQHIFGLQSLKTFKFMATGYFTPVSVHNSQFIKSSYCYLELNGEYSGIFMLNCNWGGGGWLKFGAREGEFALTSGIRDKDNRVLVRALLIGKNGPS
jgi:hypothetical protein